VLRLGEGHHRDVAHHRCTLRAARDDASALRAE
jgi:hypothetical protein